jgi:iron complex transport system substrate-binding protein
MTTLRTGIIVLVPLLLLLLLAACASPQVPAFVPSPSIGSPTTMPAPGLTLTDDAGRQVTVKALAKRIVSLAPSNSEMVYAIGQGDLLVGDTEYCDYPPEAKSKPKVGSFSKIDLERVVGLEPDLVLATDIHTKSIVPELVKRGLTVVVLAPQNVVKILDEITLLGKLTGATDAAAKLNASLKTRLDQVTAKAAQAKSKPRVFFELSKDLYTAGPSSFLDDLITRAGGINIAADAKGAYPQLTLEALVQKDPEVILLGDHPMGGSPEEVRSRPGWATISAVKTGRVIPILDQNVVNRAGPRAVDGLEVIAKALYPDLFK